MLNMDFWKENNVTIEEIKKYLDELVADGFIRISGHNKKGEPEYEVTEIGLLELNVNSID